MTELPDLPHAPKKSQWVSDLLQFSFSWARQQYKFTIVKILTAMIEEYLFIALPKNDKVFHYQIEWPHGSYTWSIIPRIGPPRPLGILIIGFDYDDAITVMRVTFSFLGLLKVGLFYNIHF